MHPGAPVRVLLADDDQDDRIIITDILQQLNAGYEVTAFDNGEHALAWLRASLQLPEIIFLDDHMPMRRGDECAVEIRQDERLKHIPIVILSISNVEKDRQRALACGATAFLTKPNTLQEFKEQLAGVVKAIRYHQICSPFS